MSSANECFAVTDWDQAGVSQSLFQNEFPSCESRPWVEFDNPKDIRAFVLSATAEELHVLAKLVLEEGDLPPDWKEVRARIAPVVFYDEVMVRKLMSLQADHSTRRRRRPQRECGQGSHP